MRRPSALSPAVLLLAAGCATPPPAALPPVAIPAGFRNPVAAGPGPATAPPAGRWWEIFGDADLDDLVARARQHSPRIAEAQARLAQAQAVADAAAAQRRPQLALSASATRQGGPLVNAAGGSGTLLSVGAGAAYDTDIAGRSATLQDAAVLEARAAAAQLESARLQLAADVAQQLLALRALDAEAASQREQLAAWRATQAIAEQRARGGSIARDTLARGEADIAAAEAEAQATAQRRAERLNALAQLVGGGPEAVRVNERSGETPLPELPAGIPAQMLARRADVAATQARLQAALARAGVAQAAWFPDLTLSASAGQASPRLQDLLASSVRAWSLGALLSLPLADGGRREAARRQAQAEVDLALAQHHAQVLQACREVEDQLAAIAGLAAQAEAQQRAAAAALRSAEITRQRHLNGLASRLEVLDGERSAQRVQLQWQRTEAERRQALVALLRALGGGWGDQPPARQASAGAS